MLIYDSPLAKLMGEFELTKNGNVRNALNGINSVKSSFNENELKSLLIDYDKIDAKEFIIDKSNDHRITIINEAHSMPSHRVFTESILQGLYDSGYRYFGIETLGNGQACDTLLNKRGYPVLNSGFYSAEPMYGNLIRKALEIGFQVFPYEATGPSDEIGREVLQAQNINRIFEKDSSAKILVHCGFDHVLEGTHSFFKKCMAQNLEDFSGHEVFTIDQVVFSEYRGFESVDTVVDFLNVDKPTILSRRVNNEPFNDSLSSAKADVSIFHPRTEFINGRPDWIAQNGRKLECLSVNNLILTEAILVRVYKKGESTRKAVPIDVTELLPSQKICCVSVPEDDYVVIAQHGKYEYRVKVNDQ